MRNKLTLPAASVAAGLVLAALAIASSISTPGTAQNNYEERLDTLETRVAVLEEEVGIAEETSETSQTNQSSQQGNVWTSSSSSQTNVSQSSSGSAGSYSASFTSSGDNEFEVEIDSQGSYTLAVTAGSAFTIELVDADGDPVPAFSLASDEAGTLTATGELQPGVYTLRVDTDSTWTATIMSSGS